MNSTSLDVIVVNIKTNHSNLNVKDQYKSSYRRDPKTGRNATKDTDMRLEVVSETPPHKFEGFVFLTEATQSQAFHGKSFCNQMLAIS